MLSCFCVDVLEKSRLSFSVCPVCSMRVESFRKTVGFRTHSDARRKKNDTSQRSSHSTDDTSGRGEMNVALSVTALLVTALQVPPLLLERSFLLPTSYYYYTYSNN